MGEGQHVQLLVDVVVPEGVDRWMFLTVLVEELNAVLHRSGLHESVWVVPGPDEQP